MALPLWTILLATFGLIWFWKRKQAKKEKLGRLKELPGPTGLPVIGNILQMGNGNPNEQFCNWTKEYGKIYKVRIGSQNIVVVSDPKLTKEIFSTDPAFTGRLTVPEISLYEDTPDLGIVGSEGERWEVHRRFFLRQLRDFGFGKSSMQALISDEVQEVIEKYKKKAGTPVGEIRETLKLAVVNSLWRLITSKRFNQDDPKLLYLAKSATEISQVITESGNLVFMLPKVARLLPDWTGYNALREFFDKSKTLFLNTINEKRAGFKDGDANDFIDVYLAEMKKEENNPKSQFYGETAIKQLLNILLDTFFAGSDTTATTLAWGILYLCKFPDAQEKLQAEISEITGDTRTVGVEDRPNMPYTLALIDEILRCSSIIPDGVQHRAMADREFQGYLIEKDDIIQANLYFIHHDTRIWGDPENFRPERFLTPDGKKYVKNENLQAFQVGRRQCVGETLARDSLFLYITNIFQQFSLQFNPDVEEPSLDGIPGFIRGPVPYSVVMTNRLKA